MLHFFPRTGGEIFFRPFVSPAPIGSPSVASHTFKHLPPPVLLFLPPFLALPSLSSSFVSLLKDGHMFCLFPLFFSQRKKYLWALSLSFMHSPARSSSASLPPLFSLRPSPLSLSLAHTSARFRFKFEDAVFEFCGKVSQSDVQSRRRHNSRRSVSKKIPI